MGVIVAGGAITYLSVGAILEGARFERDLISFLSNPSGYTAGDPAMAAPFVLILIPAVLGALGTREMLRIVFLGLRKGDPPLAIVKAVALYLAGTLVLVLVALFTTNRPRY